MEERPICTKVDGIFLSEGPVIVIFFLNIVRFLYLEIKPLKIYIAKYI